MVAFNTFYQFFVLITFKNQLAHVYWRRWYENNGRLIFTRIFRYSLDSFVLAQIVIIAYLFVGRYDRYGAACIPLPIVTFIIKIIGTRWFNAVCTLCVVRCFVRLTHLGFPSSWTRLTKPKLT